MTRPAVEDKGLAVFVGEKIRGYRFLVGKKVNKIRVKVTTPVPDSAPSVKMTRLPPSVPASTPIPGERDVGVRSHMRSACLTGGQTGRAAHAVDRRETADTSVSAGEGASCGPLTLRVKR
jgi:hypothetical protein